MSRKLEPLSRVALIRQYGRDHSWIQNVLAFIWTAVLVALCLLLSLYTYARVITSGYQWLALLIVIGVLIWILFVAEGAELAAAALADKDPEQLTNFESRSTLQRIKGHEAEFLNGKQALVVAIIVIVTLVSSDITNVDLSKIDNHLPTFLTDVLKDSTVRIAFVFGFPNFMVLWTAQLYPKLIATADPEARFRLLSHQKFIDVAIGLERLINVGAPSVIVGVLFKRELLGRYGSSGLSLRPSRNELYRALCTLVYGFGITSVHREIVVRDDGSVEVAASQTAELFIDGIATFGTFESWVAPIVRGSEKLDVSVSPPDPNNLPRRETKVSLAEIDGKAIEDGKLAWTIEFPQPLPIGAECTWRLNYETSPNAFQKEYYLVSVGVPMRHLDLIIRPQDEKRRGFFEGRCVFEGITQNRDHLRRQEDSRIKLSAYKGGYKASVQLPLVGSVLRLSWQTKETGSSVGVRA